MDTDPKTYWMTECRIAEVFVDLESAGDCYVRLESVPPYMVEVNGKKGIVFLETALTKSKDIHALAPIEFPKDSSGLSGLSARVYESKQTEFEVTKNGNRMKSTQLLSIKTSRQKIRAWVDFTQEAEKDTEPASDTRQSSLNIVKTKEAKLICFTAI